jgi:hypothetical protein
MRVKFNAGFEVKELIFSLLNTQENFTILTQRSIAMFLRETSVLRQYFPAIAGVLS